jgi:hypothetical protein
MTRRRHEQPQKGNPHKLPIKQHVLPVASIVRFTNNNGVVRLHHVTTGHERNAKPSDDIFCAKRAWDTGAETGFMKHIEDQFQPLASLIIKEKITKIDEPEDKHKIDLFFALWRCRAIYKTKDMTDVPFKGILTSRTLLTRDQEERLEKAGFSFIRDGGVMPTHHLRGDLIRLHIGREMPHLKDIKWAIVRVHLGQFIVPDRIDIPFIPLDPTRCLFGSGANGTISKTNVIEINRYMKQNCEQYYFANDLRECF